VQKILTKLIIFPVIINAAYNPFFTEVKPIPKQIEKSHSAPKQRIQKIYVKPPKPQIPARTNISLTYFGFIETNKGKFALVNFNGKVIVVKARDSLYNGGTIYKIVKITSNNILIEDPYKRIQSVYFSSI